MAEPICTCTLTNWKCEACDNQSVKAQATPEVEDMLIYAARQAGVRRGINACIDELYLLRSRHNKRSSGYNDLTLAIDKLTKLSIEEVEW
jgi:hypothetical protein